MNRVRSSACAQATARLVGGTERGRLKRLGFECGNLREPIDEMS